MTQWVGHPPPSQIPAQLFAGSGSEKVRSKQQLDTNQETWWNTDYLQAVPRLWNVCLPASRLISLIAWALQQNSSPLCLRWSCVHSPLSTLKESQACFNMHLSKEALREQNPEPSFSLGSSLFLSGLVLLPSKSEGTTKGFSFDTSAVLLEAVVLPHSNLIYACITYAGDSWTQEIVQEYFCQTLKSDWKH